jgi:glucokinase
MPEALPREDRADHVILVGDVGGTYARFALARNGRLLDAPQRAERAAFADLATACRAHLSEHSGGLRIDGAAIAAAGRVQGGRIAMTNADWSVDPATLAAELGLRERRVLVLNDFGALAWSLPSLAADELLPVPGGGAARAGRGAPLADPGGHRVVLGPGSGLGVAALLRTAQGWQPLATEGGHASAAPETALEQAAVALAAARFGRTSWERLLSGPGLALLHEAACLQASVAAPAGGAAATLEGCTRGDEPALRAARCFVELLGAFAGDLALLFDATGGVVIGGGIVPRIAAVLPLDGLRTRFEAKGRFSSWLETVPVGVLASPFAALRGAAVAYRG